MLLWNFQFIFFCKCSFLQFYEWAISFKDKINILSKLDELETLQRSTYRPPRSAPAQGRRTQPHKWPRSHGQWALHEALAAVLLDMEIDKPAQPDWEADLSGHDVVHKAAYSQMS